MIFALFEHHPDSAQKPAAFAVATDFRLFSSKARQKSLFSELRSKSGCVSGGILACFALFWGELGRKSGSELTHFATLAI